MALRQLFKRTVEEVRPFKLWASWLQGLIIFGLFWLAGYLAQADRFVLLAAASVTALLSVLVLDTVKNDLLAWGAVWAIAIAACVLVLWTVVERKLAADNFEIYRISTMLMRDPGEVGPDGKLVIRHASWRTYVQNQNDFPVSVSVVRQYGGIEKNRTELDPPESVTSHIVTLNKGQSTACQTDDIEPTLYLGRYYDGEVSCIMKYGRDKSHLDKTFDFTRKVRFLLCPDVNHVCDMSFL